MGEVRVDQPQNADGGIHPGGSRRETGEKPKVASVEREHAVENFADGQWTKLVSQDRWM
jgi:hypothetical protein